MIFIISSRFLIVDENQQQVCRPSVKMKLRTRQILILTAYFASRNKDLSQCLLIFEPF